MQKYLDKRGVLKYTVFLVLSTLIDLPTLCGDLGGQYGSVVVSLLKPVRGTGLYRGVAWK